MVEIERLLNDLLDIELSKRTAHHLHRQCRLVGPANHDDFVSSVILECLETQRRQSEMNDNDVFRAIDRVGHRIRRGFRHKTIEFLPEHAETRLRPDVDIVDISALREALADLSPLDMRIIESHFIEGESINSVAERLGIAKRTLYRRIAELKRTLKQVIGRHM